MLIISSFAHFSSPPLSKCSNFITFFRYSISIILMEYVWFDWTFNCARLAVFRYQFCSVCFSLVFEEINDDACNVKLKWTIKMSEFTDNELWFYILDRSNEKFICTHNCVENRDVGVKWELTVVMFFLSTHCIFEWHTKHQKSQIS